MPAPAVMRWAAAPSCATPAVRTMRRRPGGCTAGSTGPAAPRTRTCVAASTGRPPPAEAGAAGKLVLERGLQFVQPGRGGAVARRAPVSSRRQGAPGRDLGRIGDGAALELRKLEEAEAENLEPFADRGEVILPLQRLRIVERPEPGLGILPRLVRHEGDLGGRQTVAEDMVEEEIVQLGGADPLLGRLHAALPVRGDELRRDLGVEDRLEDAVRGLVELAGLDRPADQILDQGLGHAGIDAVMAHLVADAIGGPAQGDLAEVAGADDEAGALVGEAEEIVGP